jgi:hypothetical protein
MSGGIEKPYGTVETERGRDNRMTRMGQYGQNIRDRTSGTGYQDGIFRAGRPGCVSREWSAWTGQRGQDGHKTVIRELDRTLVIFSDSECKQRRKG